MSSQHETSGTGNAVVIGASGGIGAALADALERDPRFARVHRLSRRGAIPLDLCDAASIEAAAAMLAKHIGENGAALRLVIVASGFLHDSELKPERSLAELNAERFARAFAINATGPALVAKHFLPLMPKRERSVLAVLSARVGSIGDNRLGGWHAYRASKAALNQIVRTVAIEEARRAPGRIVAALHPGTVDTALSQPFARNGLAVVSPAEAAGRLLRVIDGLHQRDSGGFFNHDSALLPW